MNSARAARFLTSFFLVSTLEGLVVIAGLLGDSPASQGAWFLGLTRTRVIILGAALALTALLAFCYLRARLDQGWLGRAASSWATLSEDGRSFRLLVFAFYLSLLADAALLVNGSIRTNVEPGMLSRLFLNRGYLLFLWLSLLILQALALHYSLAKEATRVKLAVLLLGALLLALLLVFWYGAESQLLFFNVNRYRTDQSAYMTYARLLKDSGYRYPGDFNRMPLYPALQSLLLRRELTDPEFFRYGKYLNLFLSMVALAVLSFVFFRAFTPLHAVNLTAVVAFSVFIYKAGWFQAEILFYFLNFCLFALMLRLLSKPSWQAALAAGIMAGLAHLTKASILPGLLVFLFYATLRGGLLLLRDRKSSPGRPVTGRAALPLLVVPLVGLVFIATVFPYIRNSRVLTGRYFYNVNSTFYLWYDNWQEVRAGTRAHGDRSGWPDMPPEELPSLAKYLREHTAPQMAARLLDGGEEVMARVVGSYGYLEFVLLYGGLLVIACVARRRLAWVLVRENPWPLLFSLTYFALYVMLYFWYAPIASGDRLILALFLPLMFAMSLAIHALLKEARLSIAGRSIGWIDMANLAILPFVLIAVYQAITHGVYVMTGGG